MQEAARELAVRDGVGLCGRRHLAQGDLHARLRRLELVHHLRRAPQQHAAGIAKTELSQDAAAGPPGDRAGLFELGERAHGLRVKGVARGREGHRLGIALEELRAEFGFHLLDGAAERRLRDRQPRGGPMEMQLFRQDDEVLQLSHLHFRLRCVLGCDDTYRVSVEPNFQLDWISARREHVAKAGRPIRRFQRRYERQAS